VAKKYHYRQGCLFVVELARY